MLKVHTSVAFTVIDAQYSESRRLLRIREDLSVFNAAHTVQIIFVNYLPINLQ